MALGRTDYLVWWGTGTWPLWLAMMPAVAWLLTARTSADAAGTESRVAQDRLVAAWTVSALGQVTLPRLFWPHYYLLPVPGIALVVALLFSDSVRSVGLGTRRWPIWGTLALLVAGAIGWTGWVEYRDYLSVPPEELTIRYKGGRQWVVLREMGEDLAQRSSIWHDPHLYVWGWQSPLFFYSGLDGVSRHFFADPLLKAYASRSHPLTNPRVERIIRDLRAHPPELIFAGDPPFPALSAFLHERYLPSRLVPVTPDGRGLWVERDEYGPFETAGRSSIRGPRTETQQNDATR